MKIQSAINETKNRFGVITKAGGLTLALVAAPAIGAAAYGASSGLNSDGDLCVVATRTADPDFFAFRGSCKESDLPASVVTPENPNPSPTPVETAPPITVERASVTNVELYASDARKIILINNGGFLEVIGNKKVFITPNRGDAAREILGYPASWAPNGYTISANASPDGKTIVVYTGSYAAVSFDGGTTWSPQKTVERYNSAHQYISSDVSADGKVVVMAQGQFGATGTITWLNSASGRQVTDWKTNTWTTQYAIDVSGDGSTLMTNEYNGTFPGQTKINLNADPSPTRESVNLYGYTWFRDFAVSSNFQEQLRAMRDGSGGNPTYLFTSSDGGATMTKKMLGQFWALGVSDDGVIQSALRTHAPDSETGQLYMSFDSGENWKKMDVLDGAAISGAELAPDGKSLRLLTADSKTYFATVNP